MDNKHSKMNDFKVELASAVARYGVDMKIMGKTDAEILAAMGHTEVFMHEAIETYELVLFRLYGEDYAAKTVAEARELQGSLDLTSEEADNNENV